jgi:DNA-binding transcriptional LysR family regulator
MDKLMRRLDLDLLQTLVTIAETGSLSAAADQLCRSQSAVSEQLRKLEEFCGVELCRRGKRGARPTPAGERLIVHAREMLALNEAACHDMAGTALAGDLRLAITDYFQPRTIISLLQGLRSRYPHLRLHVAIRASAQIEQDAQDGDIDIGLTTRVLTAGAEDERMPGYVRLRREPLLWVAASSYVAAPVEPLPLVALRGSCSLHRFAVSALETAGIPHFIAHSASGVAGLQMALTAGLGVACLNQSAIPAGMVVLDHGFDLPRLPDVRFALLPPRPGESSLVADVRKMLANLLAGA